MKIVEQSRAPSPRRVRIFLAEKGIAVPCEQVDLMKLDHRSPRFAEMNAMQQVPVLVLDDGTAIAESVAICRYFEELQPEPPLFGTGALERARVEMWQRRVEFGLLSTVASVFRHLYPAMAQMEVPQVAAWGELNKPKVLEFIAFLDRHLADRPFVCGERLTVADITGLVAIDFMKPARVVLPDEAANVRRWHAALAARPSAGA